MNEILGLIDSLEAVILDGRSDKVRSLKIAVGDRTITNPLINDDQQGPRRLDLLSGRKITRAMPWQGETTWRGVE